MTAKETDYEGGTTMFQECQGTSHQRSEVLSTRYVMDGGNGFHRCPNGARRGGDGNKWILRSAKVGVDDISKNIQIQAKERTIHSKQAY